MSVLDQPHTHIVSCARGSVCQLSMQAAGFVCQCVHKLRNILALCMVEDKPSGWYRWLVIGGVCIMNVGDAGEQWMNNVKSCLACP